MWKVERSQPAGRNHEKSKHLSTEKWKPSLSDIKRSTESDVKSLLCGITLNRNQQKQMCCSWLALANHCGPWQCGISVSKLICSLLLQALIRDKLFHMVVFVRGLWMHDIVGLQIGCVWMWGCRLVSVCRMDDYHQSLSVYLSDSSLCLYGCLTKLVILVCGLGSERELCFHGLLEGMSCLMCVANLFIECRKTLQHMRSTCWTTPGDEKVRGHEFASQERHIQPTCTVSLRGLFWMAKCRTKAPFFVSSCCWVSCVLG